MIAPDILSVARGEVQRDNPHERLASWLDEAETQLRHWRHALARLIELELERDRTPPAERAAVEEDLAEANAQEEECRRRFMAVTADAESLRAVLARSPAWRWVDPGSAPP